MKLLKITATAIIILSSTSANAWWGPFNNNGYNNYNNGNIFNNFMNDMTGNMVGDMDFEFDVKIKGRGFGNMFNNWNGNNNWNGYNNNSSYYGYAPTAYAPAAANSAK